MKGRPDHVLSIGHLTAQVLAWAGTRPPGPTSRILTKAHLLLDWALYRTGYNADPAMADLVCPIRGRYVGIGSGWFRRLFKTARQLCGGSFLPSLRAPLGLLLVKIQQSLSIESSDNPVDFIVRAVHDDQGAAADYALHVGISVGP